MFTIATVARGFVAVLAGSAKARGDAIALKRIDANTVEATLKKAGKVVQTNRSVISDGGKVMTLTSTANVGLSGKTTKGTVTVYERQ